MPAATLPAVDAARADLLLLARLLPGMQNPRPGDLARSLAKFFAQPPTKAQWDETIARLRHDGLIEPRALRLTDAGRAQALEFLGLSEPPARLNWQTVQARYLLPRALGLVETPARLRKKLATADGLAAHLLAQRYGLPLEAGATLTAALEALVCKQVQFGTLRTLRELKRAVLSRLLEAPEPLTDAQLKKQLPRVVLGASNLGGLRDAALRAWLEAPGGAAPAPQEFDLPTFANTVRAVARDCPTGRFGDNKVFIHHVWRRLRDEPSFPPLDLPDFKRLLVDANAGGLLTLSRADLVQVMDPADVAESETRYHNAVFHFVLTEGGRS